MTTDGLPLNREAIASTKTNNQKATTMSTETELLGLVRELTPEAANPSLGTIAGWFDDHPENKWFRRPRQRPLHSDLTVLTSWFNRTALPRLRRLWRLEGYPSDWWEAEFVLRYLNELDAQVYDYIAGHRVILVARHTRNEESIRISAADLHYQLGTPVSFIRGEGVDSHDLLVWYDLECRRLPLPPLPNLLAVTERFVRMYIAPATGETIRSERAYARYDQQMREWHCRSLPKQEFEAAVQTIFPQTAAGEQGTMNGIRWKDPIGRSMY